MADARQGAKLQTCNNELVRCLDELCERRCKLEKEIRKEEQEKSALEAQFKVLKEKLDNVNASLAAKHATKAEYDKTISDSEQSYLKILESSQVLLNVVKKESAALSQKNNSVEKASTPKF